jgi:hypothetical protein
MSARNNYKLLVAGLVFVAALAPIAAVILAPGAVTGTADLMTRLPAYERYRCALCHTSATPAPGSAGLNSFGTDFQGNDSQWDQTLAILNSDGDRCLNGFELGDEDGDGTLDSTGQTVERSNPADGTDCSIALTRETWGKIKELFRSEMPDYLSDDGLDEMLDYLSDERLDE